jgi:uncharacterized protein with HEPN domain
MPKRDDDLLIYDMINCCERIVDYTEGMNYENFISDKKKHECRIEKLRIPG